MKLKRIDPWSAGRLLGALYAVFGVVAGLVVGCAAVAGVRAETGSMLLAPGAGVFALIAMPVFYGVVGWISGIVTAAVYNLVAGWVGGIEIELGDD